MGCGDSQNMREWDKPLGDSDLRELWNLDTQEYEDDSIFDHCPDFIPFYESQYPQTRHCKRCAKLGCLQRVYKMPIP